MSRGCLGSVSPSCRACRTGSSWRRSRRRRCRAARRTQTSRRACRRAAARRWSLPCAPPRAPPSHTRGSRAGPSHAQFMVTLAVPSPRRLRTRGSGRRRVVALRLLEHRLGRLVEEQLAAWRRLLEEPVHPAELALARLRLAGCGIERSGDRRPLERVGVHDRVDEAHLLGLVGLDLLPGEHHLDRRLRADQPRQPLRAACPGLIS